MPDQFSTSLPYILLASGAGILGSVIALFWNPNVQIRSAVQHFAAGAVLAAVAASVIPEVEQMGTLRGVVSGLCRWRSADDRAQVAGRPVRTTGQTKGKITRRVWLPQQPWIP